MLRNLFGKKQQENAEYAIDPPEDALMNAIEKRKNSDPMIGLKIGSEELYHKLMLSLKEDEGVHICSLLGIIGSLAGYSCHVAALELLDGLPVDKYKNPFLLITDSKERRYYFGDLPNQPLVEGKISIWSLTAGIAEKLGAETLPDIDELFSHVTLTVGEDNFGVPNIADEYKPADLPLNYVKQLWPALEPFFNKFCDSPVEIPILLGLAAQKAIERGKDTIPPDIAVKLVMECAVPMSKIGAEWLEDGYY